MGKILGQPIDRMVAIPWDIPYDARYTIGSGINSSSCLYLRVTLMIITQHPGRYEHGLFAPVFESIVIIIADVLGVSVRKKRYTYRYICRS